MDNFSPIKNIKKIKVIGFDADDTLWANEPYFRDTEQKFYTLLGEFMLPNMVETELYKTELANMSLYGYGIKAFMLSMIETALKIGGAELSPAVLAKIIKLGREQLQKPVVLIDGAEKTLKYLKSKYRLILVTKGDLLDQERKLNMSGLMPYFHHIEIMSDKRDTDYRNLLKRIEVKPAEFLMVGNSLKSDILPVLTIGGNAIHIPFHTIWEHEKINPTHLNDYHYEKAESLTEMLRLFKMAAFVH